MRTWVHMYVYMGLWLYMLHSNRLQVHNVCVMIILRDVCVWVAKSISFDVFVVSLVVD